MRVGAGARCVWSWCGCARAAGFVCGGRAELQHARRGLGRLSAAPAAAGSGSGERAGAAGLRAGRERQGRPSAPCSLTPPTLLLVGRLDPQAQPHGQAREGDSQLPFFGCGAAPDHAATACRRARPLPPTKVPMAPAHWPYESSAAPLVAGPPRSVEQGGITPPKGHDSGIFLGVGGQARHPTAAPTLGAQARRRAPPSSSPNRSLCFLSGREHPHPSFPFFFSSHASPCACEESEQRTMATVESFSLRPGGGGASNPFAAFARGAGSTLSAKKVRV